MSFILAKHIQVEVVNIIAYIAGFLSIKMPQKSYPLTSTAIMTTMLT